MPTKSQLLHGLTEEEIQIFLSHPKVQEKIYEKNERIFRQGETPKYLFVLHRGTVAVDHIDLRGKRDLVNFFKEEGTVFGEVYLYLDPTPYDFGCVAQEKSTILQIPKDFLYFNTKEPLSFKICNNMLKILSQKALFLNKKLLITNATSLRQKIAKYILENSSKEQFHLELTREDLANFLGISRPSLSRELMSMQNENLLSIDKNKISFSRKKLENIL